jgi:hypothetical protein
VAKQFHDGKVAGLGISNPAAASHVGTGDQANHGVDYFSFKLVIDLTSFDNDPGHVIVRISKIP